MTVETVEKETTVGTGERTYIVYDMKDTSDRRDYTIEAIQSFVHGMWMDDQTIEQSFIDSIYKSDVDELKEMLEGCDFTLVETEEAYQKAVEKESNEER